MDPKKIAAELRWLSDHPEFEQRPATLLEFLGPDYLNIESRVRESIKRELTNIMGEEVSAERPTKYQLAMITGGIGIGKTTIASIVLPYLAHWVLCLKDPQGFFDLLPGSRIAFMQMSTSEGQAAEVVFGDIKARIQHSPWFIQNAPYDMSFKKQLRFPKDIWVLPGDSAETTFEGYNILGGILDEADSHKVTKNKDYADAGFTTISARITSRFEDKGFMLVIGQMKKGNGFAARKYKELKDDPDAYAVRMTIWESLGWDHYEKDDDGNVRTFHYDVKRKMIVPKGIKALTGSEQVLEIPVVFQKDFENNPEKALRDLAGIPPAVGDPFISLVHKIDAARDRWIARHGVKESPVDPEGRLASWFRNTTTSIKRVGHLDIAYSAEGDALGFSMGHVREVVDVDGEMKPYIVIDLMYRLQAPAGTEIFLGDVRRFIYSLRDDYRFKLDKVTMDGFQSTDTVQQLKKKRISSERISVDKDVLPYHDLREALYEDRIEFPPYMVYLNRGDTELVEIAYKELSELVSESNKIDHPAKGSKDVADTLAGVVTTLMGDRRYHKKVQRLDDYRGQAAQQQQAVGATPVMDPAALSHPAFRGGPGIPAAPTPTDSRSPFR
jgi:hypothetical protein